MKKGFSIAVFFLLAASICTAEGNKENAQPQQQTQQQIAVQTQQQPLSTVYWNGDGGKGIRLAVLEPTGKGLSASENWMPSMIQSSVTGDFQKYSAMTIIDRQNLEKILGEQKQSLSGNYSDDDYVRIGKLTNARYVLAGSITKTASAFMLELAVTDVESGERKASYPPKAVSPFALENLSAVKEATAELLRQLGVQLTNAGLLELNSTANTAQVKAETALAKGIEAQKQGTTVEALSYFIQASNYNTGLTEAVSRMNILTANISSGNIGEDTRNDIAWRRQWVARLQETETFFANSIKAPQPYYIVYSTDIRQGKVDYQKETTDLTIWMGFYPDYVWAENINEVISAVERGLQSTGRAQVWELDWPTKSISNPSPFITQTKNSTATVVVEIINSEGRSIGRQTVKSPYGFESWAAVIIPLWQWEGDVVFTAVSANLITDKLTIRITSIDGIAAENASKQKNISVMPLTEWESVLRTLPSTRQNIERQAASERAIAAAEWNVKGHSDFVSSIAVSHNGRQAISGSFDNTLKLWDVTSGRVIRTFLGHSDGVICVAFSPDGKQAISGSSDNTLKLWDVNTGTLIRTFSGHSMWVYSVAFSPDGKQVISGSSDNTLKLWDVASGRLIRTFSGRSSTVYSVAFSHDGKQVISGCFDNTLKLWDVATGSVIRTFTGHSDSVFSVAFSPDGRQVISSSRDNTLKLWDVATGRVIRTFSGHSNLVQSVAFSPDGKQAISGSMDKTLKLWDIASGREVRTFSGHSSVQSVAFSPDGKQVISGDSDGYVRLWNVGN
jgi:TolB-like protein